MHSLSYKAGKDLYAARLLGWHHTYDEHPFVSSPPHAEVSITALTSQARADSASLS